MVPPNTLHSHREAIEEKKVYRPPPQYALRKWLLNSLSKTVVPISKVGFGEVAVPSGAASVLIMEGPRVGKESGRVAYVDCNSGGAITVSV